MPAKTKKPQDAKKNSKPVKRLTTLTDEDYKRIRQYLDEKLPDALLANIVEE